MSWLTSLHKQTATYWAPSGVDNFGDPSFNSPTTMKVKWEDKSELFLDANGRESVTQSVVYLSSDVIKGGYLFLGTSEVADPLTVDGAYLIKAFRKIPDDTGINFERKAML